MELFLHGLHDTPRIDVQARSLSLTFSSVALPFLRVDQPLLLFLVACLLAFLLLLLFLLLPANLVLYQCLYRLGAVLASAAAFLLLAGGATATSTIIFLV